VQGGHGVRGRGLITPHPDRSIMARPIEQHDPGAM
jgi:hypothetical protein